MSGYGKNYEDINHRGYDRCLGLAGFHGDHDDELTRSAGIGGHRYSIQQWIGILVYAPGETIEAIAR